MAAQPLVQGLRRLFAVAALVSVFVIIFASVKSTLTTQLTLEKHSILSDPSSSETLLPQQGSAHAGLERHEKRGPWLLGRDGGFMPSTVLPSVLSESNPNLVSSLEEAISSPLATATVLSNLSVPSQDVPTVAPTGGSGLEIPDIVPSLPLSLPVVVTSALSAVVAVVSSVPGQASVATRPDINIGSLISSVAANVENAATALAFAVQNGAEQIADVASQVEASSLSPDAAIQHADPVLDSLQNQAADAASDGLAVAASVVSDTSVLDALTSAVVDTLNSEIAGPNGVVGPMGSMIDNNLCLAESVVSGVTTSVLGICRDMAPSSAPEPSSTAVPTTTPATSQITQSTSAAPSPSLTLASLTSLPQSSSQTGSTSQPSNSQASSASTALGSQISQSTASAVSGSTASSSTSNTQGLSQSSRNSIIFCGEGSGVSESDGSTLTETITVVQPCPIATSSTYPECPSICNCPLEPTSTPGGQEGHGLCPGEGFPCAECPDEWFCPAPQTSATYGPNGCMGWACAACQGGWFCMPPETASPDSCTASGGGQGFGSGETVTSITTTTTTVIPSSSRSESQLTPPNSPTSPPAPTVINPANGWYYAGCWADQPHQPVLAASPEHFLEPVTNERCVRHCLIKGYTAAGTSFGDSCFCGLFLNGSQALDQTSCSATCSGDKTQICGGNWALSLYTPDGEAHGWAVIGEQPLPVTAAPPVVVELNIGGVAQVIQTVPSAVYPAPGANLQSIQSQFGQATQQPSPVLPSGVGQSVGGEQCSGSPSGNDGAAPGAGQNSPGGNSGANPDQQTQGPSPSDGAGNDPSGVGASPSEASVITSTPPGSVTSPSFPSGPTSSPNNNGGAAPNGQGSDTSFSNGYGGANSGDQSPSLSSGGGNGAKCPANPTSSPNAAGGAGPSEQSSETSPNGSQGGPTSISIPRDGNGGAAPGGQNPTSFFSDGVPETTANPSPNGARGAAPGGQSPKSPSNGSNGMATLGGNDPTSSPNEGGGAAPSAQSLDTPSNGGGAASLSVPGGNAGAPPTENGIGSNPSGQSSRSTVPNSDGGGVGTDPSTTANPASPGGVVGPKGQEGAVPNRGGGAVSSFVSSVIPSSAVDQGQDTPSDPNGWNRGASPTAPSHGQTTSSASNSSGPESESNPTDNASGSGSDGTSNLNGGSNDQQPSTTGDGGQGGSPNASATSTPNGAGSAAPGGQSPGPSSAPISTATGPDSGSGSGSQSQGSQGGSRPTMSGPTGGNGDGAGPGVQPTYSWPSGMVPYGDEPPLTTLAQMFSWSALVRSQAASTLNAPARETPVAERNEVREEKSTKMGEGKSSTFGSLRWAGKRVATVQ